MRLLNCKLDHSFKMTFSMKILFLFALLSVFCILYSPVFSIPWIHTETSQHNVLFFSKHESVVKYEGLNRDRVKYPSVVSTEDPLYHIHLL